LIDTPVLCARLLIQLTSAVPLGSMLWITLPCSLAALTRGLLASNVSSTSTISATESGRREIYSASPFSKPALVSVLPFPLFLPFFVFWPFPPVLVSDESCLAAPSSFERSEERRVGKDCRSRWLA